MNTIMIAYYAIIRNLRDWKAMVAFIVLPIILISILGMALDREFTPQDLPKSKVGVLIEDQGNISTAFEQFIQADELKSILEMASVQTFDDGMNQLKSNKLDTFIYLPSQLSKQIESGQKANLELYSKKELSPVKSVLDSFVQNINLNQVIYSLGVESLPIEKVSNNVEEFKIPTEGRIPRGIDYYSITTLLQTLLMASIFGVFTITKDIGNHTYSRINTAPIRLSRITLGKLIGNTATLFGISLIIIIVNKFIFQANLNGNVGIILLVLLMFTTISIGMGMIFAYLSKSTMIASLIMFILSTVLTLVSGGFSNRIEGPVVKLLSYLAPNSYAQEVLFTNIYEGAVANTALLNLLFYTLLIILLTFICGRRRIV